MNTSTVIPKINEKKRPGRERKAKPISFRNGIVIFAAAMSGLHQGFPSFFEHRCINLLGPRILYADALSLRSQNPASGTGNNGISRRDLLSKTTAISVSGVLFPWLVGIEDAEAANEGTERPIAIVGATGRTGSLCVDACLRRGIPVRALTRTGEWYAPPTPEGAVATYTGDTSKLLSISRCDVVQDSLDSVRANLEGCRAVIYAASASKKGGSALEVDNLGVVKTADACLEANVGRCIVISSTATTRPKSLGYVFTNLGVGGNIMGEKRNGEVRMMEAYKRQQTPSSSSPSYTIIRPGGLEEPKRNKVLGPSILEVSQGDVFSGIISRADVAEVTVELALSEVPNVKNTAIELYYTDSVVPVENRFKSLLASESSKGEASKLRLHGNTYEGLLQGIRSDIDFAN